MSKCPFQSVLRFLGVKPNAHSEWVTKAQGESVVVQVTNEEFARQMNMINLTKEEIQLAKAVQPLVIQYIDQIVGSFYSSVLGVDHLKAIIEEHSTLPRLKETLQTHLIEMFSGRLDEEYFAKRTRVAEVHVRIGLEPKWYMGAFQNLQNKLIEVVYEHGLGHQDCLKVGQVISKILNFEQQLVLDAYEKENIRQKERQYTSVKEELKAKISAITEDLTALAEQTSASVEVLVTSSQDVNRSVRFSSEKSESTQTLAESGRQWVRELESRIRKIHDSTSGMEQMVHKLNDSAQQIRHVVGLVKEIAEQTNMLAINSSIEAARAGEHGRGFSIVANEVHQLSEQTKKSVIQITSLINDSTQLTTRVVDAIREVQEMVEQGQQDSVTTREAFDEILNSMKGSISEVKSVEAGIAELVKVIEEIGSSTQKVAISAEELNVATSRV